MLFNDSYHTIKAAVDAEFKDRGSKFIGFAFPINNEDEVKTILNQIKKEHSQANHHCYAFRLTNDTSVFRASDDREPSGSAGKPILGAILSKQITNVLVIVVRYFGGSLLGVPGLINAYKSAAELALNNAEIIEKTINEKIEITFTYENINEVYQLLRAESATIVSQQLEEECLVIVEIRKNNVAPLIERFKNHPILAYKSNWKIIENI
jgi:uncharacterized YigZ family protein